MPELLIELFSEEIPARMQARAAEDFCGLLLKALSPLMTAAPRPLYGPRRIAAVGAMAARAETAGKEERGPRIGAPDAALDGFLRKHNASRAELTQEGQFWVLAKPGAVIEAEALIAERLPALLRGFPWPKSMRWGRSDFAWVRPLQRILCVLDGKPVAFALAQDGDAAHGLAAANLTEGHRILAGTAPFAVAGLTDYLDGLRARRVIAEPAERERLIEEGIAALARAKGLAVVPDRGLLAEVAGLVEWPVPLLGAIDAAFMDLPPEVMRTTMRVNQRYFSICQPDGRAAPHFAIVSNIIPADGGAAIIAGNERVLRARLSDARFFWDQDRKQRLEDFLPKLESVVFHAKLGTQGERVRRLERLAALIAPKVGAEPELAARAAKLAKADLASGMVGEFPELQGVMGRYYALAGGEEPRVAEAIGAHYRPLGPGDAVPAEPVAVAVALADKIDQLVGFFRVGEKPTGSGDPFALRRAALGIIRIVRENALRLPLQGLIHQASHLVDLDISGVSAKPVGTGNLSSNGPLGYFDVAAQDVIFFLVDRMRIQLRSEGARHDVVAAAFGAGGEDDLLRLLTRAEALKGLIESEDGQNLLAAYKRAANILRIENRKDGPHEGSVDLSLLTLGAEQSLADSISTAGVQVAAALAHEDFRGAMAALAILRAPVDAFFEAVVVNEPNPELRRNRLRLLGALVATTDSVADFSRIEG